MDLLIIWETLIQLKIYLTKKLTIIKSKIDSFKKEGFKNIILAGHSMGGWHQLN